MPMDIRRFPSSPLAAMNVMPACPAGVVKYESYEDSLGISLNPQLIETATTPGVFRATFTAFNRFCSSCGLRVGGRGLHHQDVGARGDGMRPLDVQRLFDGPAAIRLTACLIDHRERRIGQAVPGVERLQVGLEVGVAIHLDQGDRLARAVSLDRRAGRGRERDRVQSVGTGDLSRRVAARCRSASNPIASSDDQVDRNEGERFAGDSA